MIQSLFILNPSEKHHMATKKKSGKKGKKRGGHRRRKNPGDLAGVAVAGAAGFAGAGAIFALQGWHALPNWAVALIEALGGAAAGWALTHISRPAGFAVAGLGVGAGTVTIARDVIAMAAPKPASGTAPTQQQIGAMIAELQAAGMLGAVQADLGAVQAQLGALYAELS